ncbi:hypothetical protein [Paenibacillus ginsengihumi]|jgi:catechol 2,3-dioxygenase-like lactoylglutathione lyase family enzyme|uniref:hypothetical protein n=1 Tax=Paenibacillus ginsengihumi TaxID=431596 RepID=UPI00035FF610|nr:hypothetical protein [Paenibacillus ginsengihumi]
MNIQGFNHATIRVSDLERPKSFGCGVPGMHPVQRERKDVYLCSDQFPAPDATEPERFTGTLAGRMKERA